MKYPPDFVRRVKEEYPYWTYLHRGLDRGNKDYVGRCLDDSSTSFIPPVVVLEFLNEGKTDELRDLVIQIERRRKLYTEWRNLQYNADP